MARPVQFTYPASDTDSICIEQTSNGAPLVIDGPLALPIQMWQGAAVAMMPGIQRVVTITCSDDISSINFTIEGYDLRGNAVSETLAGPDTTPTTVSTTAQYHVVTSITPSAAVASFVLIGTGDAGQTNWYVTNYFASLFNVGYSLTHVGTIDVDLNYTMDNVQNTETPTASVIDDNITTDVAGVFTTPCQAIQADVQAGSTGSFVLTLIQTG